MNVVILTGTLIKKPEVRYTSSTAVARVTLAVKRGRKVEGQPDADFINCVAFGKTAEFIEKYFDKGMKAEVRGRWQTGSYKKDDGTTVYTNDCIVDEFDFAERKGSQDASASKPKADVDGFLNVEVSEEELPFM